MLLDPYCQKNSVSWRHSFRLRVTQGDERWWRTGASIKVPFAIRFQPVWSKLISCSIIFHRFNRELQLFFSQCHKNWLYCFCLNNPCIIFISITNSDLKEPIFFILTKNSNISTNIISDWSTCNSNCYHDYFVLLLQDKQRNF